MIVRSDVYEEDGGFDRSIFRSRRDVDLSWRVRAAGKRIVYVPGAVVNHFVLGRQNTAQSELREYYGTEMGRLLLAYKYGTVKQVWRANLAYLR